MLTTVQVFLIDDSASMRKYWNNDVYDVFEALSYVLKKVDTNGLDLHFTTTPEFRKECKDTTPLLNMIRDHSRWGTSTDMNLKLSKILDEYQIELEKPPWLGNIDKFRGKPLKPLSLYIHTDGIWETDCDNPIRNIVAKLKELKKNRHPVHQLRERKDWAGANGLSG